MQKVRRFRSHGRSRTRLRWCHRLAESQSHMTGILILLLNIPACSVRPAWNVHVIPSPPETFPSCSGSICHSWKISSSRSLRFLVSLVMVSGTVACEVSCWPPEDEVALWDLTGGRQAGVSPVQTSSTPANLRKKQA